MLGIIIGSFSYANAIQLGMAELEVLPYLKGGSIAWDKLEGKGDHKFILAGGLNTNVKFNSLGTAINLEKWWVAEGLDNDKGMIPKEGYSLSTEVKYFLKAGNNILFYTFYQRKTGTTLS